MTSETTMNITRPREIFERLEDMEQSFCVFFFRCYERGLTDSQWTYNNNIDRAGGKI